MRRHAGAARVVSVVILGTLLLAAVSLRAQAPSSRTTAAAAPKTHRPAPIPRTADGRPDLQGTWDFAQLTPFERPGDFAGKTSLTDQEAEEFAQQRIDTSNKDRRDGTAAADVERAYNDFWWDRGTKVTTPRTSLVVDPPDGRVPSLTDAAKLRAADEAKRPAFRGAGANGRGTDSWLDRSTFERCITRGMPGAMSPTAYNNNYRITQGPGYVAIQIEMLGGARVIPTDGRSHVNQSIRQWMGDSVARWEGDTLVVEPRKTCTWSSASPALAQERLTIA
jgi:hypothetical protein